MDKSRIALALALKYLDKKEDDSLLGITMKYFPEIDNPVEVPEGKVLAALFQDIYANINISSDKA